MIAVNITLGRIYIEQGKNKEALDEFEKALLIDPNNTEAFIQRANTYLSTGNINEAELSYKKAIEIKPSYWKGYSYLGFFYFKQGNYSKAAAQFKQVITLNPNNAKGYRNIGSMYYIMDRYDDAIEMYNKSLEFEEDYRTYNNLATIYGNRKDFKKAAETYEKLLKIKDTDYRIWGYLGYAYYKIPGENEKAIERTKKAISMGELQLNINPKNVEMLCKLSSYYGLINNLNKTLEYLKTAEALNPTDMYQFVRIAEIYEEWLKRRDEALKWINKALQKGFPVNELETKIAFENLLDDPGFKDLIESVDSI